LVTAVEGVCKQGRIEVSSIPRGMEESRVVVIFLPSHNGDETATEIGELNDSHLKQKTAAESVLQRMKSGFHLGGGPYYGDREEIYDRIERHPKDDG